jgi:MFS family permease
LGPKRVIITGSVIILFSLLFMSFSVDFLFFLIMEIILGFGLGMYAPAGLSILMDYYPPEKRGQIVGIHEMAAPSGMSFGPIFASLVISWGFGWQGVLRAWITSLIVILVCQLLFVRERELSSAKEVEQHRETADAPRRGSWPTMYLLMFAAAQLLHTAAMSGSSMLPTYWVAAFGVEVATAALIYGIMTVFAIFGQLGSGYLSDMIGRLKVLLILQFLTSIMIIPTLYLPFGPALYASFAAFSVFTNGFMPVLFAFISDTTRPIERSKMVGIIMSTTSVSSLVGPPIIGYLAQTYSYAVAWVYPVAATFLSIPLLIISGRKLTGINLKQT